MDVLTSSEFRKVYAKLTRATIVSSGGHVIGLWTPRPPMSELYAVEAARLDLSEAVVPSFASRSDEIVQRHHPQFRPVPKPSQKGR